MREKLIELLEEAKIKALGTIGSLNKGWGAWYADYLLKNGVVVLPCKVGDAIYMPWEWKGTRAVAHLTVTHIVIDCSKAYVKTDFNTDDEDYFSKYNCGEFAFAEIGNSIFLTKEEAEAALVKGANKVQKMDRT